MSTSSGQCNSNQKNLTSKTHHKYSQAPQSLDLRAAYADLFEKHDYTISSSMVLSASQHSNAFSRVLTRISTDKYLWSSSLGL